MHTFQPLTSDLFSENLFSMIGKDWMLITAANGDKVNTMTASWGGAGVLWGKDVVYIFVRESRYTKEFIDASETFSLSFFGGNKRSELKYLGAVSGRDEDKVKNSRLTVSYHKDTPYFDEANIVMTCKKLAAVPITKDTFIDPSIETSWYKDGNFHTMYVGEITEIMAR